MHAMNEIAKSIANRGSQIEILYGSVISYTANTTTAAAALSVDFEGAGTGTSCMFITSYTPTVGDSVVALSLGTDVIVLGTFG